MMVIVTHGGRFHADEVMAVAILMRIFPDSKVIRSRDPNDWKGADFVVDVGKLYDGKMFFDHHQEGGAGKRQNGVSYASAGLVWKDLGQKYIQTILQELGLEYTQSMIRSYWLDIDYQLIQGIDAADNFEVSFFAKMKENTKQNLQVISLSGVIGRMNPPPLIDAENSEDKFMEAVQIAQSLLESEVKRCLSVSLSMKLIEDLYQVGDEIIFIDQDCEWRKAIKRLPQALSTVRYVIVYREDENRYRIYPVDKSKHSQFLFPKEWRGLWGNELRERAGVASAHSCHNGGILFTTIERDDAFKVARLALAHANS